MKLTLLLHILQCVTELLSRYYCLYGFIYAVNTPRPTKVPYTFSCAQDENSVIAEDEKGRPKIMFPEERRAKFIIFLEFFV